VQVTDELRAAILAWCDWFADESRWCKDEYSKYDGKGKEPTSRCAEGATFLGREFGIGMSMQVRDFLSQHRPEGFISIVAFNDAPDTTWPVFKQWVDSIRAAAMAAN
jgi:hypothetical protein